ncbi:hypothetical protein JCM6882_000383 [Rhodosporidiobolus microsporus]
MSFIPAPPEGTNPFLFYRHILHSRSFVRPDDINGVKARLIVLFVILAILLVASLGNFGVHLYSSRLKKRPFWLFRLVERDGGRHILSNNYTLCPLVGIVLFIVLFGELFTAWRAWINPGEGRSSQQLTHWILAVWPTAYAVGWMLSWASFSAYLQVDSRVFLQPGKKGRLTMPAWLENCLFVGGGIGAVSILATLAGVAGHKSDIMWHDYHVLEDYLLGAADEWDGSSPLSETERTKLLGMFREWQEHARVFYHTVANMCIGAAVLPLLIVLINCLMFSFVFLIRRQIKFQLANLPSFLGSAPGGFFSGGDDAGDEGAGGERGAENESPFSPTFRLAPFAALSGSRRGSGASSAATNGMGESEKPPLSPSRRPSQPSSPPSPLANVFDNVLSFVPLETLSFSDSPSPSSPASPAAAPPAPHTPVTHSFGSPFTIPHPLSTVKHSRSATLLLALSPPQPPSSTPAPSSSATPALASPATPATPVRSPPTRNQVREIADDVEGAAVKGGMAQVENQMAERIVALVKAEQELLLIGLSVLIEALFFTITCAWSAPTLHSYRHLTFPKLEAVVTLPIWLCAVGVAVAEIGHAWVEWRWSLRRWVRRERWERRRGSESAELATRGGALPPPPGGGAKTDASASSSVASAELAASPRASMMGAAGEKRRPSFLSAWRSGGGGGDGDGRRTRAGSLVSRGLGLGLSSPSSGHHHDPSSSSSSSHPHPHPHHPATRIEVAVEVEVTRVAEVDVDDVSDGERERWEEGSVRRHAREESGGGSSDGSGGGGSVMSGPAVRRKEAWED